MLFCIQYLLFQCENTSTILCCRQGRKHHAIVYMITIDIYSVQELCSLEYL